MNCFPCFSRGKTKSKEITTSREIHVSPSPSPEYVKEKVPALNKNMKEEANKVEVRNIAAQIFTFRELAIATNNFRTECLLGEGGFGRVYKATLEKNGKIVAVKQLDKNGLQGNKEFLVEVLMLSLLRHQNLVNLTGYCADGDQRLLVYDYMPGGSLEQHLFDIGPEKKPLDWFTRMKIASGAARGMEYLHDKANPPVIYRDFKTSNILLDEEFNPRLSDFGLAKLGSDNKKINVSSRVMGTYGYCAPEYARTGELTLKSDVYSFGIVLLELITGRRAIDTTRPTDEQNLVTWAQPIFKDPKRFPDMADPLLNKQFTVSGLNQAVAIAAMCLNEEASVRPLISDVVAALSFLSIVPDSGIPSPIPVSTPVSQENLVEKVEENGDQENHNHRDRENSCDSGSDSEDDREEGSENDQEKVFLEAKDLALSSRTVSQNGNVSISSHESCGSGRFHDVNDVSSGASNNLGSYDESVSSKYKNITNSQDESGVAYSASNSVSLHEEHDSLSHKISIKSNDEHSVSSSASNNISSLQGNNKESEDGSAKSRNEEIYSNHSLSRDSSRGSQGESVSWTSSNSSSRSGSLRVSS